MTLFQNGDVRWTVELGLTSQEDASSVWDTALWGTGSPPVHTITGLVTPSGSNYVIGTTQPASNPQPAQIEGLDVFYVGSFGQFFLNVRLGASGTDPLPSVGTNPIRLVIPEIGVDETLNWNVTQNRYQGSTALDLWALLQPLVGEPITVQLFDPSIVPDPPGLWSGYAPNYVDVTDYVFAVNTRYGARRFGTRMQTGRAYVTFDNSQGWFNPNFGADLPGDLDIRLGRWCRISAVEVPSDITWVLFEGIIDTIDEVYLAGASDSSTRITVYDFASMMALDDPPALETPVGGGELTSARVNRILDEFGPVDGGWPWRDIATGDHTLQASTLAQNRLEESHRAAEAEGGAFYFENGRYATFRPFQWLTGRDGEFPRSEEVQLWPGRGLVDDPELVNADAEWTANQLRNDIQLARIGGSSVRVQNTQSELLYGSRTFRRLNLENDNDSQVLDLANRYLSIYQWDYQRLEAVTLRASTVTQAHNVFRSRLGDLVSTSIPLTLRGWGYSVEAHIIGIEYTVTANDWDAVLRLDQAFRQAPGDAGAFSDGYDDGYLIGGS